MLIQVTREHIEKGNRVVAHSDPVALALKEHLPRFMEVSNMSYDVIIYFTDIDGYHAFRYDWDDDMTDFIRLHDGKMEVDPIEFELPIEHLVNWDA